MRTSWSKDGRLTIHSTTLYEARTRVLIKHERAFRRGRSPASLWALCFLPDGGR